MTAIIVEGTATKHRTNDIHMSWDSPISGNQCWVQGELGVEEDELTGKFRYTHVVYDEDLENELYTVVSQWF